MPKRVPQYKPPTFGLPTASRHRLYDRTRRDPEAKAFYDSRPWRRRRVLKLSRSPLCERCLAQGLTVAATHVHHKQELAERPDLALDLDNLESLCAHHHSQHHAQHQGK